METTKVWKSYEAVLYPALKSKAEEFQLLGIDKVNPEAVWTFCVQKKWRKVDPADVRIYQLAQDILSAKVQDFMSFQTIEAIKSPDLMKGLSEEDFQALFRPKN
ncbi:post-transcriptional regulator [Bacillus fonticola]|uniref:post-transcriptional regulator n=1 Tax=Bacillus fonticola TaxID=2728853 RepID=UPI001474E160|nr:post-transcriptional regulator [Bacillus fonticola]